MSNEHIMALQPKVDAAMESALKPMETSEGILLQIRVKKVERVLKDEDNMPCGTEEKYQMFLHLDDNLFKEVKSKKQVLELYECLHTIKTNIMLQDGVITAKQLSEKGIIEIKGKKIL